MALVTVNVFLLFLNDTMKAHKMAVSVAVLLYLFFWVITNDLLTFNHLQSVTVVDSIALFSIAVQYPTFVSVYVYILYRVVATSHALSKHWMLWVCLLVSLSGWSANQFACKAYNAVFIGHVVWHIGIGYVANYLIAVGAADTYDLDLLLDGVFPKLKRKRDYHAIQPSELSIDGFWDQTSI
jgi:hypothetical protein